jgi:hypothetical protein
MAVLKVATSGLFVSVVEPGAAPPAQLPVSLQLPSVAEPPFHVWEAACTLPIIANARAGRRNKACRKERKATVAVKNENDVF